jgi:hypothetical protein
MHAAVVPQAGLFDATGPFFQPVPGVFLVFTDVFLEDDAQEKLHGLEAGFVHVRQRRQHGADPHIERPEALVSVSYGGVDKADVVAHSSSRKPFKSFKPFKKFKASENEFLTSGSSLTLASDL